MYPPSRTSGREDTQHRVFFTVNLFYCQKPFGSRVFPTEIKNYTQSVIVSSETAAQSSQPPE